jgi:hypothetical protein
LLQWLVLVMLVAAMLGVAWLISRQAEARLAPRLRSGLVRLSDVARARLLLRPRGRHAA